MITEQRIILLIRYRIFRTEPHTKPHQRPDSAYSNLKYFWHLSNILEKFPDKLSEMDVAQTSTFKFEKHQPQIFRMINRWKNKNLKALAWMLELKDPWSDTSKI